MLSMTRRRFQHLHRHSHIDDHQTRAPGSVSERPLSNPCHRIGARIDLDSLKATVCRADLVDRQVRRMSRRVRCRVDRRDPAGVANGIKCAGDRLKLITEIARMADPAIQGFTGNDFRRPRHGIFCAGHETRMVRASSSSEDRCRLLRGAASKRLT